MPIYDIMIAVEPNEVTYRVEADSLEEARNYLEEKFYTDIVEISSMGTVSNDQESEADFSA